MKTVFRNSQEIVHLWAHQTQGEGTMPWRQTMGGSGRMRQAFFEGPLYFSYGHHYCIGRLFPGNRVALNRESNSSTTNRHRQEARLATQHMKQVFVFDPEGDPNKQRTEAEISDWLDRAASARPDGNRPSYIARALATAEDFNTFCDWTERPDLKVPLPVLDAEGIARIRKAQREEAAKARAREKERVAQLALSQAEKIAAWRAGAGYSLPYGVGTMLRVNPNNPYIDTSLGAHIPVDDAKRLWPLIQRTMRGERDYEVGMPLGDYQLTKIRRDGSIKVGCHDIPFDEIEGIAVKLGLASLTVREEAHG